MSKRANELTRTVTGKARYIRISPYKVREVIALIKGKPIDEARRILAFTPKAASHEVSKVLESAIANAEHNFQIPQEELIVKFASADEGLTIDRFRPRAQGRAFRIRKRTSSISLVLERLTEDQLEFMRRPKGKQAEAKGKRAKKKTPAVETETAEAKPKRVAKKKTPEKASKASKAATKPAAAATEEKEEGEA